MTTVVVVHGTGVRQTRFNAMFMEIEAALHDKRPDLDLLPCFWGDEAGAKLRDGLSIPNYRKTLGPDYVQDEDIENVLWEQLYKDPLYELRTLSLLSTEDESFGPYETPNQQWNRHIHNFVPSGDLKAMLMRADIAKTFNDAWLIVISSVPYGQALRGTSLPWEEFSLVIARAIVAQAITLCEDQDTYAAILTDSKLRDEVVVALSSELINSNSRGASFSLPAWVKTQLSGLAMSLPMDRVQRKRGAFTNSYYALPGDVLLYQVRGDQIRECIRQRIDLAKPPVVVLAHSLGGIATVDLLVKNPQMQVDLLITVGSQASFLYEIGALFSLPYEESLPTHFPPWLNIYDVRDFLSYIVKPVFKSDGRIEDREVNNKLPFPQSHSAYWRNPQTWDVILPRLPQRQ